ncbi:hypothetical protein F511_35282 [Dorcoceras hygrometricum]|uniref:Uncharacterized protein n=1 Tax=Dorcoceras hygrometricum TaxID=472368 RepID=A0A2Z7BL76_9LAMI|nr:hypothetical protein F511_35282 [Dorcoceras hygrometricum]
MWVFHSFVSTYTTVQNRVQDFHFNHGTWMKANGGCFPRHFFCVNASNLGS